MSEKKQTTVSPEHKITVIVVNELISRFYRTAMDIDQSDIVYNCHGELVRLLDNSEELTSYVKNFDAIFNKEWEEELGSAMKELMHKYIYEIAYCLQDHLHQEDIELFLIKLKLEEAQSE